MNDADKLAIAEEILRNIDTEQERADLFVHLDFIYLRRKDFCWFAHKPCTGCESTNAIASSESAITCVLDARQKLAAEREAAKSPRERRIEKVLADVTDYAAQWFFSPRGTELLVAAREALKE